VQPLLRARHRRPDATHPGTPVRLRAARRELDVAGAVHGNDVRRLGPRGMALRLGQRPLRAGGRPDLLRGVHADGSSAARTGTSSSAGPREAGPCSPERRPSVACNHRPCWCSRWSCSCGRPRTSGAFDRDGGRLPSRPRADAAGGARGGRRQPLGPGERPDARGQRTGAGSDAGQRLCLGRARCLAAHGWCTPITGWCRNRRARWRWRPSRPP
jgi:hypothetical protein